MRDAIYLPALNTFLTRYWDQDDSFAKSTDFLNNKNADFYHPYALVSAAHANRKNDEQQKCLKANRSKDSLLVADSGGFQIITGVLTFDWDDLDSKKNNRIRQEIFDFQNTHADYALNIEAPTAALEKRPEVFKTFQDCLDFTLHNLDFYAKQPTHHANFVNVMQGRTESEAFEWYNAVKGYDFCNSFAFGGMTARNLRIMLSLILQMMEDGFEPKLLHVLGQSRITYSILLTVLIRSLNKVWKDTILTYDSAGFSHAGRCGEVIHNFFYHNDRISQRRDRLPKIVPESYQSEGLVPLKATAARNMTMKEFLEGSVDGKWTNKMYALVMLSNLEIQVDEIDYTQRIFDAEICQFPKGCYRNPKPVKTVLPTDLYYLARLIEDVIESRDRDLLNNYTDLLERSSVQREDTGEDTFNTLFDTGE